MNRIVAITVAALFCSTLWAGPAPWYKWHSEQVDYDVCAQIWPGDGWVIVKGPFEDSGYKKLAR
jgi:hypothetical protein